MNIPKKIKVGYKEYTIEMMDQLDDGCRELYGQCHYDDEIIKLCTRYPINQQKCTLVHELIHAVDNMCHVGLSEKQVTRLGKGLYQLIKDNPELFEKP